MTDTRTWPATAIVIVGLTVVAWLAIIAIAFGFDRSASSDRLEARGDDPMHVPIARPGRAGPGYLPPHSDR